MWDFLTHYTFGTPDFGHSDLLGLNLSDKFLLGRALQSGNFPFWSKNIGTGFPLAGEGQTGMFNLFNMVAFRFLDPILAFNLGYIVIWLTTFLGTYLFARLINLSRISALFFGIIFSLSGVFVTHISHFNLIQTASFFPFEIYLVEKFVQTNQKRWLLIFSFVLSQQIFSGFPQLTLISLVGLLIYSCFRLSKNKKRLAKQIITLGSFLLLGFVVASPQLLANWQLIQLSFRQGISIPEMSRFPIQPKQILAFINPYLFGDPRVGTFPTFSQDWGIFWESTGYIGVFPLLLAGLAFHRAKKRLIVKICLLTLVLSLILMLGKYTPFFFVFQIPPLNQFRVPARFLFLFVWSLAILAAVGLDSIKSKKLAAVLVVISFIDIFRFAASYNPVISAKQWLAPPETVRLLKSDSTWFRIYPITAIEQWNKIFFSTGWKNIDAFLPFQNNLDANTNLFWDIPSVNYYKSGLATRRQETWTSLMDRYPISSESGKLLSLAGVKYVVSPYSEDIVNMVLIATTSSTPKFYIFENAHPFPHAYLTQNYLVVNDLSELTKNLSSPQIEATILEEPIPVEVSRDEVGEARVTKNTDLEVAVDVSAKKQSLLILSDSYFPSWRAYIDNQETKIYPANLNQRAVVVPSGHHTVRFVYRITLNLSLLGKSSITLPVN